MTYQHLVSLAETAQDNTRMQENITRLYLAHIDTGNVRWELQITTDNLPSVSLNLEYFVDNVVLHTLVEQIRATMTQRTRDALTTLREESNAFLGRIEVE